MKVCEECSSDYEGEVCPFCVNGKPVTMHDPVKRPAHYMSGEIECWDIIKMIPSLRESYHLGNVFKYIYRHKMKHGIQDLKKARNYLDDLIKWEEANAGANRELPSVGKIAGAARHDSEGFGHPDPTV